MTVGIFADLHDNLVNFETFLRVTAANNLAELWIAGDCGTAETLQAIAQIFSKPIRIVAGNVETGHDIDEYEQVTLQFPHLSWSATSPFVWDIDHRYRGALFHYPAPAATFAQKATNTLVISGHTHQPTLEQIGTNWHVNPGTLGGVFTPATYVVANLETPAFELRRLYI